MLSRSHTAPKVRWPLFLVLWLFSLLLMLSSDTKPGRFLQNRAEILADALLRPLRFVPERLRLWQTNILLEQELMSLNLELARLREFREETRRLQHLAALPEVPGFRLLPARVLTREDGNFLHALRLGRGARDSVVLNAPVICTTGLVGKVVSVQSSSCRVILLNDPLFRARVRLGTSGVEGIVYYDFNADALKLKGIPLSTVVVLGDTVRTSGLASIFPPQLPLAVVSSFETTPGLFWDITLRPVSELRALYTLGILLREEEP